MFVAGKILFIAFFDICRFRKGPQDLPESRLLLALSLLAYGLISTILMNLSEPLENSILATVLEIILLIVFIQAALQLKGKSSRWTQTLTALSGTGVIISLVALPLYFLIGSGADPDSVQILTNVFGLTLLPLLACWNITVIAHILCSALEIHFVLALILSIAYIWILFNFTMAVIPLASVELIQ